MQKTIVIIFILIAVFVAGFLLWFKVSPATPSQPAQTNSGGFYTGGSNTTGVTSGGGQQPQTPQSVADIEQGYRALFQKILATQIVFTPVSSSTGELGSVYKLYASDVAAAKKSAPTAANTIDIALVDLTDDKVPEAIVYEDLPLACGSGGCPFEIYQKVKGAWVNIFSTLGAKNAGIANVLTNGYLDLFLSVHGDLGFQTKVVRYAWDGKAYQPKETMATWSGSAFVGQ